MRSSLLHIHILIHAIFSKDLVHFGGESRPDYQMGKVPRLHQMKLEEETLSLALSAGSKLLNG